MRKESQLLKGCLEGCVLKLIDRQGEIYGYHILKTLKENGFHNITEGTLYPLYTRLQKKGLLCSVTRESAVGPARKYYSLTPKGHAELEQFTKDWAELTENVNAIMRGTLL